MQSMPPDFEATLRQQLAASVEERAVSKHGLKVDVAEVAAGMVRRAVEEEIQRVVASIPKPKDGADGKSLDAAELATQIAEAAARILAALPPPRDGRDGKDGTNGKDGKDGKDAIPLKRTAWAFDVLRDNSGQMARLVATPLP